MAEKLPHNENMPKLKQLERGRAPKYDPKLIARLVKRIASKGRGEMARVSEETGISARLLSYHYNKARAQALTEAQGSAQSEEAPDSSTNDSSTSSAQCGANPRESEDRNEAH